MKPPWASSGVTNLADDPLDPDELTTDETGLVIWGGVELDLTLSSLQTKVCAVCGAPATLATRRLEQRQRTFACDAHRSAS